MICLDQSMRVSQTSAMVCSAYKPMRRRLDVRGNDLSRAAERDGVKSKSDMSKLALELWCRACGEFEIIL